MTNPVETEPLTTKELRRYSRHLLLPELGRSGQQKLKESSVLMIGAGGLGSPMSMYLAAAGVGRLGIVDFDTVDESNLHRQIIYGTNDVGRPKLESAARRLHEINPHVEIERFETRLTSENALELFDGFDLVADGTDNFPTRYLVNDAAVMSGIPNVYASIFRFDGQVSVFGAPDGPCYRCLYPEPPPPGLVPSCAEGGVLGVLPGIVGTLQATEVIKQLTGIGESLVGRLLIFDALEMEFRTMKVRRDPACPVCGDNPSVTELIDYEQFCGITPEQNGSGVEEMSVGELKARIDNGNPPFVLDVRNPEEADIATIGAPLIPLDELDSRLDELEPYRDREIVIHCRTGVRSANAARLLREHGFERPINLAGGIRAWSEEIDPDVPVY